MNLDLSTPFLRSSQTVSTPSHLDDDASWGIAETAAYFEITPRTIRFYEDKGLLSSSRKGGGRQFSPVQRLRLEDILRAKRAGFTLEDIREVLEVMDGTISDPDELLRRKDNFAHVIKSLTRRRQDINTIARHLENLCTAIDQFSTDHKTNNNTEFSRYAEEYQATLLQSLTPNT